MNRICPRCQSTVQATDKFCPSCGAALSSLPWSEDDYQPLPGVVVQPDLRTRRKRRRKRPWYRKPLFITFAVLATVVLIGAAGAMYYVQQQFSEINAISTPPPLVSGAVFAEEGAGDVQVDTSPAQRALELAESGQTGEFSLLESDIAGPNPTSGTATPEDSTSAAPMGDGTGGHAVAGKDGTPPASGSASTPEPRPTIDLDFTLRPVQETEGRTLNVLLMGVDARPGETIDGEVRPDSLSVLHLDGETGACRVLSIPRDTRTELPGYGLTKINHALALGGVPYETLVVEQLLGIEIDHFGLVDFAGIEGLVDAVGGVTVTNERAFEHSGFTFAEGEIELNGEEALAYSRFRYDEEGDFGRQERQQQVMRALLEQSSGMDIARSAPGLLDAVEGHFKSDLSAQEMISMATEYRDDCTPATLETATMEGAIETHPDPLLNLPLSYVILSDEEIQARVEWLIGEDAVAAGSTLVETP